ncbi:MAG TPA: sugar-binding protein [Polyangiaceae bacterium]|nr:sugar-binding protein [Polyangiaceae bacterium]
MKTTHRLITLPLVCASLAVGCAGPVEDSEDLVRETDAALSTLGGSADLIVPKYVPNPDPQFPYPLTVDGRLDYDWQYSDFQRIAQKSAIGSPNNEVYFATKWDATNLYIAVKVKEGWSPYVSYLYDDSSAAWEDDSIEIYIDPQNDKATSYDSRDRQIIVSYRDWEQAPEIWTSAPIPGLAHGKGFYTDLKYVIGYVAEISIPWASLGVTPGGGTKIGIDVSVNDDDNGGARDAQQVWFGNADNYRNTSAWGTAVLYDRTAVSGPVAKKLASPPFIDGTLYDWRYADFTLENAASKSVVGSSNNALTFTVNWDATHLYVLGKVDEGFQGPLEFDTTYNDSTNIWEDDAIELFIDPGNEKTTYFDALDRQILIGFAEYNQPNELVVNGAACPGIVSKQEPLTHYADKYIYGFKAMAAIPWSCLGVVPQAGLVIGFDLANDDDDNGGGRESQKVWSGTADDYRDPSRWGQLTLVD